MVFNENKSYFHLRREAREENKEANAHRMEQHRRAVVNQVEALKNKAREIALRTAQAKGVQTLNPNSNHNP